MAKFVKVKEDEWYNVDNIVSVEQDGIELIIELINDSFRTRRYDTEEECREVMERIISA